MKAFFRELFEYTNQHNKAVIGDIIDNRDKVSQKTISLASHIINAQLIWNARIKGEKPAVSDTWTRHDPAKLIEYERLNFIQSLEILAKHDLNDLVEWQTLNGQCFTSSVRDILFQIINHANYHRAQIATEFKQSGLRPLMTDFILYKKINA